MTTFGVTEAKIWHCGQIIRRLREEHRHAAAWIGLNSHREIRGRFEASIFRRSYFIDGHLIGIGGVEGPQLSTDGLVWLALTSEAAEHPIAVAREARRQLAEIMILKRTLSTTLIPTDKTALRFALRLGFELEHTTPIPFGAGHVIAVRYSREARRAA
jgi:hypothetical protein